jgi:trigger factor
MGIQDKEQAPPREKFREAAQSRVAQRLIVQELVNKHEIKLDPARVDERVQELPTTYEKTDEDAQLYRGSRELMAQVESSVLEDQVVDFLVEHGKTQEKSSSFSEFMGT